MRSEVKKQCNTCHWFESLIDECEWGICNRFPPVFVGREYANREDQLSKGFAGEDATYQWQHPQVDRQEICGEWKRK